LDCGGGLSTDTVMLTVDGDVGRITLSGARPSTRPRAIKESKGGLCLWQAACAGADE
jgi:hypothetical protein